MKDYYYILGIERNATELEIKTAYRKLSLKFHPDKNDGEKFFEDRFKEILEAYETLSNRGKRDEYDYKLKTYNTERKSENNSNDRYHENRKAHEEAQKREEDLKKETYRRAEKEKEKAEESYKKTNAQKPKKSNNNSSNNNNISLLLLPVIGAFCIILLISLYKSNNEIRYKETPPPSDTLSNQNQLTFNDTTISNFDSVKMNKIQLEVDGNIIKFNDFPSIEFNKENNGSKEVSFIDIDKDGIPELFINYYTGGAHCCFEYYIFKAISQDTFQNIFEFEGGENSFSIDNNKIIIDFYEQLGYFFTCYACGINDKLPYKKSISRITLNYSNNEFYFEPRNDYLNKIIIQNLEFLKSVPLPNIDSFEMDDGTRKAYAEHLIAYYFNNQKDSISMRDLFDKYYLGEDKEIIYGKILDHIKNILGMRYTIKEVIDR
jgi:curved DNA-binding protein CbpA